MRLASFIFALFMVFILSGCAAATLDSLPVPLPLETAESELVILEDTDADVPSSPTATSEETGEIQAVNPPFMVSIKTNLNLRRGPSTSAEIIGRAEAGTVIQAIGMHTAPDGSLWYYGEAATFHQNIEYVFFSADEVFTQTSTIRDEMQVVNAQGEPIVAEGATPHAIVNSESVEAQEEDTALELSIVSETISLAQIFTNSHLPENFFELNPDAEWDEVIEGYTRRSTIQVEGESVEVTQIFVPKSGLVPENDNEAWYSLGSNSEVCSTDYVKGESGVCIRVAMHQNPLLGSQFQFLENVLDDPDKFLNILRDVCKLPDGTEITILVPDYMSRDVLRTPGANRNPASDNFTTANGKGAMRLGRGTFGSYFSPDKNSHFIVAVEDSPALLGMIPKKYQEVHIREYGPNVAAGALGNGLFLYVMREGLPGNPISDYTYPMSMMFNQEYSSFMFDVNFPGSITESLDNLIEEYK
jgi:hypothetical protein